MTWSIRLSRPGRYEYGETGIATEELAREVYEALVGRVRETGGKVELLKDGEIVASFTKVPGVKQ